MGVNSAKFGEKSGYYILFKGRELDNEPNGDPVMGHSDIVEFRISYHFLKE